MSLTAILFACGSSGDGSTSTCQGAACAAPATGSTTADASAGASFDGGAAGNAAPDAARDAAPDADDAAPVAAPDIADEPFDAGTCPLQTADPSTGGSGALHWASRFGISGQIWPSQVAIDPANDDIMLVGDVGGTADFGGATMTGGGFVARFDKSGATKWAKTFGGIYLYGAGIAPAGHVVVGGMVGSTLVGTSALPGASLDFGCGVLPADTGDNDVVVVDFDAGGNCVWSKRFRVNSDGNRPSSLAVDSKGNVFLSGFSVQADFGGGPLHGHYLAKLTSAGAHAWSKTFPGVGKTGADASAVAVDSEGNSFFAGEFEGTTDFGGGAVTSVGPATAFVVKYSPSGKYRWAKQFGAVSTVPGSPADSKIRGIAVDGCGAAYVTGDFGRTRDGFGDEPRVPSTIDLGSGTLAAPDISSTYGFLAKLDASGSGVWSKAFVASTLPGSAPKGLSLRRVAVDGAGRPTITAWLLGEYDSPLTGTESSVDFGGGPLSAAAGADSFALASFDAAGTYRWGYTAAPTSTYTFGFAPSVAASNSNTNVVVVGTFGRPPDGRGVYYTSQPGTTLDLAGTTLTATAAMDMWLASFSP